ncbi:MAG: winged helix DNA-binding domain-containing protein [bacterium]|nr:winged helix DNA-binding domain-containing protein [bacterium]
MRHISRQSALASQLHANHLTAGESIDLDAAAHSGLQDGSPLSALLSLAARVTGVEPNDWRAPGLAQVFGPRGAIYVVRTKDIDVFTLGLLPRDKVRVARIETVAAHVRQVLDGSPMRQADLVAQLPEIGGTRGLRWGATAGGITPTWDTIDTVVYPTAPAVLDPETARIELARRFFRYLGPATAQDLRWWLDGLQADADETVAALADELEPVIVQDQPCLALRSTDDTPPDITGIHLLPPDDTYINRRVGVLLVPDTARRKLLWPKAPPPGALVIDGEVKGTWRRRKGRIGITPWRKPSPGLRSDVDELAAGLPLPTAIEVHWLDLV